MGRPRFLAPAGEEQHLRETSPVAQGTCLSFETRDPPANTQKEGLPVGRSALRLWGVARRPGVMTSGWQATSICPSLSLRPPPQPAASDHPRSPRWGARSPRSWLLSGLGTNARITWKRKQVCYPLKNLRRQQDGWGLERTVTVSSLWEPCLGRAATVTPRTGLLGMTAKTDRQTDRQCGPSRAVSSQFGPVFRAAWRVPYVHGWPVGRGRYLTRFSTEYTEM